MLLIKRYPAGPVQVVVEQEERRSGFLPQAALTGLVRVGGDTLVVLRRALVLPLDLAHQVDEEIGRRVTALVTLGEVAEDEGRRLQTLLISAGRRAAAAALADEGAVERALSGLRLPSRADVRSLADQLDVLEAELARMSGDQG